jgi:hypothetical protein
MTTNELGKYFNTTFGLEKWPKTYEVDAETYGNVCDSIIKSNTENNLTSWMASRIGFLEIAIGINKGILFKGVELIKK